MADNLTAADKLRELLATRPAIPNLEELFRWWTTSGLLVPQAIADLRREHAETTTATAHRQIERDREEIARLDLELAKLRRLACTPGPGRDHL